MSIVTLARAARYAAVDIAPTYSGDPTADYGTATPDGSLTITLPTATGISHWRVSFARLGAPEEFSEVMDNLPPATTSVSYIYKAGDVGFTVEPQITAVPLSAGYAPRVWSLAPQEVTEGTPDPGWPADWAESLVTWEQRVFEGGQGKGQMVISASAPANPAGYELTAYHGTSSSSSSVAVNATFVSTLTELGLNPANLGSTTITWNPSSGAPAGSYDVLSLGYKNTATGEIRQFGWVKSFLAAGSGAQIPPGNPGTFPAANQVLSSASQSALISALNARRSTGSTAPWIIELPTGNYGRINLSGMTMPGPTTIRAQDRAAIGARFTGSTLNNCSNLHFQFCDFNNAGGGFQHNLNEWYSVRNMGVSYCRIGAPEIIRDSLGIGYIERARYGIRIDGTDANGNSTDITIHMNSFDGVMGEQLYMNRVNRATISHNVSSNACGDFLMFGTVTDVEVSRNWGSRLHWPSWDPNARSGAGDFYHSDFCQIYSPNDVCRRIKYIGNVHIIARHPTLPGITRQGFLIQGHSNDFEYRDNFIVTNAQQGIWVEWSANAVGHKLYNNTVLRIIDLASSHKSVYFKIGGSGQVFVGNIQQHLSGWPGVRNITGGGEDYTASLAYYVNPRAVIGGTMSSYYDMRPVDGALTDWDYSGTPEGPAARFREVIVDGNYPKIGPAATAWKAWYDPKNQITS